MCHAAVANDQTILTNPQLHTAYNNAQNAQAQAAAVMVASGAIGASLGLALPEAALGCASNAACESESSTFIRYMSEAELRAVNTTGYLRGGRPGITYMTTSDSIFETVGGATSRLALETPPDVGVMFRILNQPALTGPEPIPSLAGRLGLGTQLWTTDPVQVEMYYYWDLLH